MKTALLVGHCEHDSGRIRTALGDLVETTERLDSIDSAIGRCRREPVALVIGNRVIEGDETGGVSLVRRLQADEATRSIPVVILSTFAETQDAAEAAGARRGFGKDRLEEPFAREAFARIIDS